MHYHIIWGPISGQTPSILDFDNKDEALDKFTEIGKTIEEAEKFDNLPLTATNCVLDDQTFVIKLETYQTRICFLYCEHSCPHFDTPNSNLN